MKQEYETYFFDLDGTVIDSAEGIENSVIYAMKKRGITETDREKLHAFIGPPLPTSFHEVYGLSGADNDRAVADYREYYEETGIFEGRVYEGLPEVLSTLKARGKQLVLATFKPEPFALRILTHFHLSQYFAYVSGADLQESPGEKAGIIRRAMDRGKIKDPSTVLMVGDRDYDVRGAKAVGMDCLGVLYGFGSRSELTRAGATYLTETVSGILAI